MNVTAYHARYYAYDLTRRAATGLDRLSMSLFDAAVDLNPHQIEAALFALESPGGKWLYFVSDSGELKRMPAGGGDAEVVGNLTITGVVGRSTTPMAVTSKGIYYLSIDTPSASLVPSAPSSASAADTTKSKHSTNSASALPPHGALIRFLPIEGGEPRTIGTIARTPASSLSVSPDGRYLLYSQFDQSSAELLLVENFK